MTQTRKCLIAQIYFCSYTVQKLSPDKDFGAGMTEEIREVRGRIPKEVKIAFEIACARLEVTQTAAIEEAIKDWLKKKESELAPPEK